MGKFLPSIGRIICGILLLANFSVLAQTAIVKGTITHSKTGEPLPFASVKVNQTNTTKADSLGKFLLSLEPGRYVITVSQVGFNTQQQSVRVGFEEKINVNIELEPKQNELDRIVVSGSRQEKSIAREVMSVTEIKPYLITNTNAKSLSDVLNNVPGITVIEGQAVIRGGTGWSYGVGSRVMVLLDDMPLVGPDVGDIQWDLLPIEAAEGIEVLKGPSSVLYGSSASAGTVNVRTGWPTNKPQTKVTFFQGVQDNPTNKNSIWWERTTQPFNTGSFFLHKEKIGQLDIVASANVFANRSHIQDNDEFRARTYLKTRYRFKQLKGLSVGINSTYMAKKAGRFFLWQNNDSGALKPYDGSIGYDKYNIYTLDPHIAYIQNSYSLNLRYRYYNITRDGTFGAYNLNRTNDAIAKMNALDFNFQKHFGKQVTLNSGFYVTSFNAVGNVYPGDRTGYSGAAYAQLEYDRKRWNIVGGLRIEKNAMGVIEQTQKPLLRMGVNYRAAQQTFLRLSYGEGFRFPTVGERYVEDNASGISVYPNPGLLTERGWYTELGVKQGFTIREFNASFDACIFWMEYKNLIEFLFNQQERSSYYFDSATFQLVVVGRDRLGFRAENRPLSRTAGFELSLQGEGNIGPIGIRTLCGYTYSYPVDLYADSSLINKGNYVRSLVQNRNYIDSGEIGFVSVLPYRNRHIGKIDIELSYKKFAIGYNAQYTSTFEKLDDPLYRAIAGLRQFQLEAIPGVWVHNYRTSFAFTPQFTLAFLVNNAANETYATRPARMDAFRSYNLQMRIAF